MFSKEAQILPGSSQRDRRPRARKGLFSARGLLEPEKWRFGPAASSARNDDRNGDDDDHDDEVDLDRKASMASSGSNQTDDDDDDDDVSLKPRAENLEDYHPSELVHHGILSASSSSSSEGDDSDLINRGSDGGIYVEDSDDEGDFEGVLTMGCMDGFFLPGQRKTANQALVQLNEQGKKELKFNMKIPIALGFKTFTQEAHENDGRGGSLGSSSSKKENEGSKRHLGVEKDGALGTVLQSMNCRGGTQPNCQSAPDSEFNGMTKTVEDRIPQQPLPFHHTYSRQDPPTSVDAEGSHDAPGSNPQIFKSLMSLSDGSSADDDYESTPRPENLVLPAPVPAATQPMHTSTQVPSMHMPPMFHGPWSQQQPMYAAVNYSSYEMLVQGMPSNPSQPLAYAHGSSPYWNGRPMVAASHPYGFLGNHQYVEPPAVEQMPSQIMVEEKQGFGDEESCLSYEVVQHIGDLQPRSYPHRSIPFAKNRVGPFPRGTPVYPMGQRPHVLLQQQPQRISQDMARLQIKDEQAQNGKNATNARVHVPTDASPRLQNTHRFPPSNVNKSIMSLASGDANDTRYVTGGDGEVNTTGSRNPVDPVGSVSSIMAEGSSQVSLDGFEDAIEKEQEEERLLVDQMDRLSSTPLVNDDQKTYIENKTRAANLKRLQQQQTQLHLLRDLPSKSTAGEGANITAINPLLPPTSSKEPKSAEGPTFDEQATNISEIGDVIEKNDIVDGDRDEIDMVDDDFVDGNENESVTSDQAIVDVGHDLLGESEAKQAPKMKELNTTQSQTSDQSTSCKENPGEIVSTGPRMILDGDGSNPEQSEKPTIEMDLAQTQAPDPSLTSSITILELASREAPRLTLLPPEGASASTSTSADEPDHAYKKLVPAQSEGQDRSVCSDEKLLETVKSTDASIGRNMEPENTEKNQLPHLHHPSARVKTERSRGPTLMFDSIHFRRQARKKLGASSSSESISSGRPSIDASSAEEGETKNYSPSLGAMLTEQVQSRQHLHSTPSKTQPTLNVDLWGKSLLEKHSMSTRSHSNHQQQQNLNLHDAPSSKNRPHSPALGPPDEAELAVLVQSSSTSSTDAVLQAVVDTPGLNSPVKRKRASFDTPSPRIGNIAPSPREGSLHIKPTFTSEWHEALSSPISNNDENSIHPLLNKRNTSLSLHIRPTFTSEWHDSVQSPTDSRLQGHSVPPPAEDEQDDEFFDCE